MTLRKAVHSFGWFHLSARRPKHYYPGNFQVHRLFSKNADRLDRREILTVLGLKSFSSEETKNSFIRLQEPAHVENGLSIFHVNDKIRQLIARGSYSNETRLIENVEQISEKFCLPSEKFVSYENYHIRVREFGEKIDLSVVIPVSASFLMTGTSVGIIIPCMPILISQLGISPSNFSLVIGAFGMSKLIGNIPAAFYVDTIGRKPMLVAGLVLCSFGIGSVGMVESLASTINPLLLMMASRFIVGLGVSAFSSGATVMMTDISTPLNRARTMSPLQAGFQGGVALGPAIGGLAINHIGISNTFFSCGAMFSLIAAFNALFTKETKLVHGAPYSSSDQNSDLLHKTGVVESFGVAWTSWRELLKDSNVRSLCLTNVSYWIALSGVQMTILPIHMVNQLHFGPVEIGGTFAIMSACSVLASQPIAYLADKKGKDLTMGAGFLCMAGSMGMLPFAETFNQLIATVVPLAIGSNAMASIPTAKMADIIESNDRTQALSLLRTIGDVGLLCGAGISGLLIEFTTMQAAVHSNAAFMFGLSCIMAKRVLDKRLKPKN